MKALSQTEGAIKSREYRRKNGNKLSHKYEKTINGFLMRLYRNMKSRVSGVQKKKWHLYKGKELLSKDGFYLWSRNNSDFLALYKAWVIAGYDQHLTPSVNRINPELGYRIDNMEWITHAQNSGLSGVTRRLNNQKTIYKLLGAA